MSKRNQSGPQDVQNMKIDNLEQQIAHIVKQLAELNKAVIGLTEKASTPEEKAQKTISQGKELLKEFEKEPDTRDKRCTRHPYIGTDDADESRRTSLIAVNTAKPSEAVATALEMIMSLLKDARTKTFHIVVPCPISLLSEVTKHFEASGYSVAHLGIGFDENGYLNQQAKIRIAW